METWAYFYGIEKEGLFYKNFTEKSQKKDGQKTGLVSWQKAF